ncbi:LysM peptidoglycan-binding domain-containing protein [Baekduia soli]|nr:LysM domain-containing protein [Baekduia soli]
MRRRSFARWLAPLAIVACALAVYLVVHSELAPSKGGGTSTSSGKASSSSTSTTRRTSTTSSSKKTYVVKSGDVLSAIAQRTGVSVADLERYNPTVDAAALHPGQKLKLSR